MKTKGNTNVLEFCIRVVVTVMFIVFNTTFNNISVISWRSVSLVEDIGVPGENLYISFKFIRVGLFKNYKICERQCFFTRLYLIVGVLDTTLCDKVCQWFATGRWCSTGTPVSTTNKTDCHDIAEILLKVVLDTINQHYCNLVKRVLIIFNITEWRAM
jgi:hypothetical protein